jgi:pyruvate carboxylase subunit B
MAKKHIQVMNTAFRDGFQSVFGARVFTKDFLPALEAAVHAGFTHFEAGGGARYQSLYFYCNEDAFDMMDAFRETVGPDANLQTLARGVNVVGLDSQSSDIIDLHAKMFKKHGMTTIRNFDALNDVRNLNYSGECITNAGLKHEVVVALMGLPPGLSGAHDAEFYVQCVRNILDDGLPFASICFKDASGTCPPRVIYEAVKQTRKLVGDDVHLRVHTHETAGASVQQYMAALEAGIDGIDLSMAPVSGGTAQPDAITMWHVLRGTDFDLGFDIEKVMECEEVLKDCMKDYFMPVEAKATEPVIPFSPMPGGALTANTQMLRDNNMMDKFPKVIAAMREVVRRGGFGSSVTPVSQFYFQQAFNNVVFGEWKRIADSYGRMVLGYFGKTPVEPDPEIVKLASEQLGMEPTTRNPREINDEDPSKGIAAATKVLEAEGLPVTDENIFIAAACKDKGIAFLKGQGEIGVRKNAKPAAKAPSAASGPVKVSVNGREYTVELDGGKATVNGQRYDYAVGEADTTPESSSGGGAGKAVTAELSGKVVRLVVQPGASVSEGDTLLVLEALKMEMEITAPQAGRVRSIDVAAGQAVNAGDVLVTIGG